jgi:hypothetical protein
MSREKPEAVFEKYIAEGPDALTLDTRPLRTVISNGLEPSRLVTA